MRAAYLESTERVPADLVLLDEEAEHDQFLVRAAAGRRANLEAHPAGQSDVFVVDFVVAHRLLRLVLLQSGEPFLGCAEDASEDAFDDVPGTLIVQLVLDEDAEHGFQYSARVPLDEVVVLRQHSGEALVDGGAGVGREMHDVCWWDHLS